MNDVRDLFAFIALVRATLARDFIEPSCREEPCFGCPSCEAAFLDTKLHALANFIEADAAHQAAFDAGQKT